VLPSVYDWADTIGEYVFRNIGVPHYWMYGLVWFVCVASGEVSRGLICTIISIMRPVWFVGPGEGSVGLLCLSVYSAVSCSAS